MSALVAGVRFRLAGVVRGHRLLAPAAALLVALGIMHSMPERSPGQSAGDAAVASYGLSAIMLFFAWAWATRETLAAEPSEQRRLTAIALGGPLRGRLTVLLAAYATGLLALLVAVLWPLALGNFGGADPAGVALGAVLHLLALTAAVALGALTSAEAVGSPAKSTLLLAGGLIGTLLLGLAPAPIGWLGLPLLDWSRAATTGAGSLATALPELAARTLLWSAAAYAGYATLTRGRP